MLGFDVRTLEMPAVIQSGARDAIRGNIAAAQRMPSLVYEDSEGTRYTALFNDESLECQSLQDLVLSCTFSATAHARRAGSVEITEGRLQVTLGTDEMADSFTEATVGRLADESTEQVQMRIDRLHGKMR